ncbi:MAG: hypothetical protein B7Y37_13665 [Sphingobacteriia bacterium 28-36-52]|nr:MAG: hypothetical protein B7Y37_13665 [Sphingobacteriia bacterium 28-36-52]
MLEDNPEIENAIIIAKFSDGKCRQVLTKQETMKIILQLIGQIEGNLRVLETPISGIDIELKD